MVLLVLCTGLGLQQARASHAAGGEMIYQWISDSTFRIIFKFYRDCSGAPAPTSVPLCYTDSCNKVWYTTTLNKSKEIPDTGSVVSPGCPNYPNTCNGGTLPGYLEFWYEDTITLPNRCGLWTFYSSIGVRNPTNNINGTPNLYVKAELNTLQGNGTPANPYNSSVYFTNKPVPYTCVLKPYSFNNGALDIDGDSLVFSSFQPLGGGATFVTNAPDCNAAVVPSTYNAASFLPGFPPNLNTNPFNTNNTFNVNPISGTVTFTPQLVENVGIAVRVDEYRRGVWIGSVTRDIQVVISPCAFEPTAATLDPSTLQNVTMLPNGMILACPGKPLNFCFNIVTPDTGALLKITTNLGTSIPAASLNVTGMGTDSAYLCFSWTPGALDTGVKTFTVTATDTSCRPPGIQLSQTYAYSIYVQPATIIFSDTTICEGDTAKLFAVGGSRFKWTALPGGDPISTLKFTEPSGKYVVAFPRKTTRYVVESDINSACNQTKDTVTITVITLYGSGLITSYPLHDSAICEPGYVYLRATTNTLPPTPPGYFNYKWTPSLLVYDSSAINTLAYVDTTTTYTISTHNNLGCEIRDTARIIVSKRDFGVSPLDTTICKGDRYVIKAKGGVKWAWSGNQSKTTLSCENCATPTALPLNNGTYQVIISDQYNCSDTFVSHVTLLPLPIIVASPHDTLVNFGTPVTLKATGGTSYNWSPINGISNPNSPTPVVTPTQPTTYTVVGRSENGCAASDTARVNLDMRDKLYMPSAFSPNKDGANDYFRVVNLTFQKVTEFRVFDRWGRQIFDGVGAGKAISGWDGMIDDKEAPLGVYNYIIRIAYPDGYAELLKGNVTLVR
jgi:gliding motility-associated-like protein